MTPDLSALSRPSGEIDLREHDDEKGPKFDRARVGRLRSCLVTCIAAFVLGCGSRRAVVSTDTRDLHSEDAKALSQHFLAESHAAAVRVQERDVLERLAELWLRVDRPDKAIEMATLHDRLWGFVDNNPIAQRIAAFHVRQGHADRAIALGDSFPASRIRILVAITRAQTERGDYGGVEKTIGLMESREDRAEAWQEGAVAAANRGDVAAAKEELGRLVSVERIHPLIAIGAAMLRAGNRDEGLACFKETKTLIMTPAFSLMRSSRDTCCQWLLDALLGGDEFDLALEICDIAANDAQFRVAVLQYITLRCADDLNKLNRVRDTLERTRGNAGADAAIKTLDGLVAACLARRGEEARAIEVVRHLSPRERQPCLAVLVGAACGRNDISGAISIARLVEEHPLEFLELLGDASHYLHASGNAEGAERVLRVASAAVRSHGGSEGKDASLFECWAITLARCGSWQESDAALAKARQDVRGHALAIRHIARLRAESQSPESLRRWLRALNSGLDGVYGYLGAAEAYLEPLTARDRTVAEESRVPSGRGVQRART